MKRGFTLLEVMLALA
ncbi:TPA: prepilin-type N-terminal cleavage/methylation domain-containing protein, partial [Escherichia coli]|nr:prepilin-type N-terminal cleavage/methylation domain-containing protein [Escherichia coli]